MIHRTIIFLLITVFLGGVTAAQNTIDPDFKKKTILKDVKAANKAQNYSQTDRILRGAFEKFKSAYNDAELVNYEVNAQYELVKQENRKIFLNSKPDTAAYFSHVFSTYQYALRCDSLDHLPDVKQRVKPRYTGNLSGKLVSLRNNLRSGGKYHYKKKSYALAFSFFDMYLSTIGNPLLDYSKLAKNDSGYDSDSVEISQIAVLSAYGNNDYKGALKYLHTALLDTTNAETMHEIGIKSLEQIKDSVAYEAHLLTAFDSYPKNDYFYGRLLQFYNDKNMYADALSILSKAIEADSTERKLWYLKGKEYQLLQNNDSALFCYDKAIIILPSDAESFSSIGGIYLQKAHDFYETADLKLGNPNYTANRKRLNEFYKKSMKAFESARANAPSNTDLWIDGLREVYYKLGEGKKLREIETIFSSQGRK